jgi:phosphatidylglycerophosphatase A
MIFRLSRTIASLFYVGFLPGMPGTYGSVITALVFWAISFRTGPIALSLHLAALAIITLIGIVTSAEIGRTTGIEDPSYIIIDEVAGQLITFLFLPAAWFNIILGIAAFRVFDIWKPFPIRKLEDLGKGVGVMADDLLAGVYANIVLQIVNLLLK